MEKKIAIGLMSGTSMDAVDAVAIETDGEQYSRSLGLISLSIPSSLQKELKKAEALFKSSLPEEIEIKRKEIIKLENAIDDIHISAVRKLKEKLNLEHIDVIGYHGQTVFHDAKKGFSVQLGNGSALAKELKIPVVYNFREKDLQSGGQGAPLAPLYHQVLCARENIIPAIVINCGGISNVTWIRSEDPNDIIAWDLGPGNTLIDRYIQKKTLFEEKYDTNGNRAQQGKCILSLLNELKAGMTSYSELPSPKSLDINDFFLPESVWNYPENDVCATLVEFTTEVIVTELKKTLNNGECPPVILVGGGWNNSEILRLLQLKGKEAFNKFETLLAHNLKWENKAIEAECFAYLAVRNLLKRPTSLPNITGVNEAIVGGVLCEA